MLCTVPYLPAAKMISEMYGRIVCRSRKRGIIRPEKTEMLNSYCFSENGSAA